MASAVSTDDSESDQQPQVFVGWRHDENSNDERRRRRPQHRKETNPGLLREWSGGNSSSSRARSVSPTGSVLFRSTSASSPQDLNERRHGSSMKRSNSLDSSVSILIDNDEKSTVNQNHDAASPSFLAWGSFRNKKPKAVEKHDATSTLTSYFFGGRVGASLAGETVAPNLPKEPTQSQNNNHGTNSIHSVDKLPTHFSNCSPCSR